MPKIKTKSGAKKRFKVTGDREGAVSQSAQAPRHDQADQEADPPIARHQRAVQDRWRQHQEILSARRLIVRRSPRRPFAYRRCTQSVRRSAMARVKRGVTGHAKHKKGLKAAKGYYGRRKNTIRVAKQAVEKANQYAYRDRKRRKRTFRALWIQRLNAAVRPFGLNLQPVHRRPRQGRPPGRPQGAVRPCDPRAGGLCRRSSKRPRPRARHEYRRTHGRRLRTDHRPCSFFCRPSAES